MLSRNREQSFGNTIFLKKFIAGIKSELNQDFHPKIVISKKMVFILNLSRITQFAGGYDAKKSIKLLSNHNKNGLIFTQLQLSATYFWVATQGLRSTDLVYSH